MCTNSRRLLVPTNSRQFLASVFLCSNLLFSLMNFLIYKKSPVSRPDTFTQIIACFTPSSFLRTFVCSICFRKHHRTLLNVVLIVIVSLISFQQERRVLSLICPDLQDVTIEMDSSARFQKVNCLDFIIFLTLCYFSRKLIFLIKHNVKKQYRYRKKLFFTTNSHVFFLTFVVFQNGSEGAQRGQSGPKRAKRVTEGGQKGFKPGYKGPKTGQRGPKGMHVHSCLGTLWLHRGSIARP